MPHRLKKTKNLIWIDLEMTGLDVEHDRILEIATVVTDPNLEVLVEGPVFTIHQKESLLKTMNDWNTTQHTKSGLLERVRKEGITEHEAEKQTIEFLQKYVAPGRSPMCGNSICQDRRFLAKYMPDLCNFFHYRQIDVSTLKELARRWKPGIACKVKKRGQHLALADIQDSINELKHYREHFLRVK